jgi:predicted GIY-YIG superfamily endonuclease|tara:strand:+ start:1441 stop:1863 length:423 start_codon:yes stop_codon:yes gene_type:complete
MTEPPPWIFYIIENNGYTYAGVSPDPIRRLRQHNCEIKGGAKYTTSKGCGWKHICLVSGFHNKIEAMQFEWAVKHAPPRNVGGIQSRIKKLYSIFHKEKWTTKSPLSCDVPLKLNWKDVPTAIDGNGLVVPNYITEVFDL